MSKNFYSNYFFRQIKLSIIICIFGLLIYGQNVLSKGIVYIYTHDFNLEWASKQPSQGHYIHEVRDGLRRLGYIPIITSTLDGLGEFDKLILLSVVGPWAINSLKKYPKERLIAFLWEPPVFAPDNYEKDFLNLFSKVYTWDNSLVDNIHLFQLYHPECFSMTDQIVPFNEKKLCVMMNANKDFKHKYALYGERRKVICFFENNHYQDFDLYGNGWGGYGLKTYKGYAGKDTIDHRWNVSKGGSMKQYRFCYAYESMRNIKGYITEKIFNVFSAGCVPIYWGADNITNYIPKNCFIDRRDFSGDQELYEFLKNMKEYEYNVYIDNIKSFLDSSQAIIFSIEYFVDIFLDAVESGYDKNIALTEKQRVNLGYLYEYLCKNV